MPHAIRPARLTLLSIALVLVGFGPCGMIAGGELPGPAHEGRVDDWGFANDVGTCAVEVRPAAPHSVTVNCMSREGRLFVSCSDCEGKRWSSYALEQSEGRIRIGDSTYPVRLHRVEAPDELDRIWAARAAKLGKEATPRPEGWWSFELTSRPHLEEAAR